MSYFKIVFCSSAAGSRFVIKYFASLAFLLVMGARDRYLGKHKPTSKASARLAFFA
jgi:hypothetical protein